MRFNAKITYEDDTILEMGYRLKHILKYINEFKKNNPLNSVKAIPITPWLLSMSFEDAFTNLHDRAIKCIEIEEKKIDA
jgi:hypothetical protein